MVDDVWMSQPNDVSSLEQLRALYEIIDIRSMHKLLISVFARYFELQSYSPIDPAPLVSEEDQSVLFTGAFISRLKLQLLNGIFPANSNGYFMSQDCLRTQDFERAYDNNFIPFGQTFFKMVGILSKPGRFEDVCQEAIHFTCSELGIPKTRVKIKATHMYQHLSALTSSELGVEVEYDSENPQYYWWNYGIESVHGEGLTICIYNPNTDTWWDVGNIVRIVDSQENEFGTEFGYGIEFLLSACLGIREPLRLSEVFSIFEFESGLTQKYYAYLEATARMRLAGVEIGHHGTSHIYKQYLKAIQHIGAYLGKGPTDVISDILHFATYLGVQDFNLSVEQDFLNAHTKRIKDFRGIVKRVGKYLWSITNNQKPKEYIADPKTMLSHFLTVNGIDPIEVKDDLERLKRFDINL